MNNLELELDKINEINKKSEKKINKIIEKKINYINNNDLYDNDLDGNLDEDSYSITNKSNKTNKSNNNDIYEYDSTNNKNDDYNDNELAKLDKELSLKSKLNSSLYPKNYGNMWNDEERKKIIKLLKKNEFNKNYGLFDESTIFDIAKKLERTEYAVKEEIKKMIYNDYIEGLSYEKISSYFNMPITNIKLILRIYIEKNSQKIINQIDIENKLMRLKIENIKLRSELSELNSSNK